MGIIYKIQNKINGKVYIGQTIRPLDTRIKSHLLASRNLEAYRVSTGSIQYAISEYGIENFDISVVEECSNDKLSEREIYYIDLYNSYKDGYNLNKGGSINVGIEYLDREKCIQMLKDGKSPTEIVCEIGGSLSFVKSVADANDIDITRKYSESSRIRVIKYDAGWNPVGVYDSITSAYDYDTCNASLSAFQHNIRMACGTRKLMYGYYWATLDSLYVVIDGAEYVCKSPLDKEGFELGMPYQIINNVVTTDFEHRQVKYCKFCGTELDDGNEICIKCAIKHPRSKLVDSIDKDTLDRIKAMAKLANTDNKQESNEEIENKSNQSSTKNERVIQKLPPKEGLEQLIKDNTYKSIAIKYGVHEVELRNVLKEYGIYERRNNRETTALDIVKYLCTGKTISETIDKLNVSKWKIEEAIKTYSIPKWVYTDNVTPICACDPKTGDKVGVFNTLIEAMEWLSPPDASQSVRTHNRYRIGQAAKSGKIYKDYIWKYIDKESALSIIKDELDKLDNLSD